MSSQRDHQPPADCLHLAALSSTPDRLSHPRKRLLTHSPQGPANVLPSTPVAFLGTSEVVLGHAPPFCRPRPSPSPCRGREKDSTSGLVCWQSMTRTASTIGQDWSVDMYLPFRSQADALRLQVLNGAEAPVSTQGERTLSSLLLACPPCVDEW